MGTRCIIMTPVEELSSIKTIDYENTQFNAISVSNDGYPSHMLETLKEIIKENKIEFIMAGGSARVLYDNYSPNPLGYHDSEFPQSDVSIVFNRDCGYNEANDLKIVTLKTRKEKFPYSSYLYLVNKDEIYFSENNDPVKFKHSSKYKQDND